MIGLIAQLLVSASWVEAGAILANLTGTPVTQADPNYKGQAISDVYTLVFSSVVAGVSATVTVSTQSVNNPYDGNSQSVSLNNTTVYSNLIPGVDLKFSSSGSFTSSWTATVTIGSPFGSVPAFGLLAGIGQDGVRVRVENTGSDDGTSCVARVVRQLVRVKRTGVVFHTLHSAAEDATEKLTGDQVSPYALNVTGVSGSGSSKTMTIDIDGSTFNVINLTSLATGPSTGLNVNDFYRATDGLLQSMEFRLSQDAVNSDFENVLCFDTRFSQIAPDDDGTPGDWDTVDVDLTEAGQATGVITASGVAYFWVRVLVPDGGNSSSNPYVCNVTLQGSAESGAGWED